MRKHWINIISIFIILGSLASWKFLLPELLDSSSAAEGGEEVRVEGQMTEQGSEGERKDEGDQLKDKQLDGDQAKNASLTFDTLYRSVPDAPVKVKDIGDVYARARTAIMIDAETGTILHYQDGKKRTAIASLTKMMTATVAMEHIKDWDTEVITITKDMLAVEGTVVGCPTSTNCISNRMWVGEKVMAEDILKAMLMNSCNDAAFALGIHIGGSKEGFAKLMNQKAAEIGLTDTHFCNPAGLDEDDKPGQCYSSAYDIARISAYSLKYDKIWDILRETDQDIYPVEGVGSHRIISTNVLLDQMPNCLGGKTGFTYEAGKSLMLAAHHPTNKKHKVIAVVIDDPYRWEDMKTMFNWVFTTYAWPK